jgi:hypothetical protein
MARPTKLTPEVAEGIATLIEHVVHPVVAAGAWGVSQATYYEWLARGEDRDDLRPSDPLYTAFAERVRTAEYKAHAALVELAVQKCKTAADVVLILERRWPDQWRKRDELVIEMRTIMEQYAVANGLDPLEVMREAEAVIAGGV